MNTLSWVLPRWGVFFVPVLASQAPAFPETTVVDRRPLLSDCGLSSFLFPLFPFPVVPCPPFPFPPSSFHFSSLVLFLFLLATPSQNFISKLGKRLARRFPNLLIILGGRPEGWIEFYFKLAWWQHV